MHSKISWKGRRVFITGGTGLLGSHLARSLVKAGAEVIALVRDTVPQSLFYSEEEEWGLCRKVTTVQGEVENFRLLERVLNEYEIQTVFHLAAQTIVTTANRSPIATFRANIEGTWNLLEAARLHQKTIQEVIIASSDKAYGNLLGNAHDESFPLKGDHPYDVSKSCSDLISRSYGISFDLPVAITRCGNFFGPGDLNYSRIIPGTVRSVVEGKAPIIRSDGLYVRDYLYVEDGAHAYMTLAESVQKLGLKGEAFNFSYGLRLSVKEVVEKVLRMMNRSDITPKVLNEVTNEIPVQCLDSSKARRELDWTPRFGFDEGLKTTVDWYQARLLRSH
jgi:CDP-glucose 4,6-dehydratase